MTEMITSLVNFTSISLVTPVCLSNKATEGWTIKNTAFKLCEFKTRLYRGDVYNKLFQVVTSNLKPFAPMLKMISEAPSLLE